MAPKLEILITPMKMRSLRLSWKHSQRTYLRQRYAGGMEYSQLIKWKQQFLEGGKDALSRNRRGDEKEEEMENLKKIIGEQSLVIDAFKKRLQGRTR
ncbi:MAG: hypothetical protein QXV17_12170 [Candidatus Micrarchaeaceae archaeon]